MANEELIFFLCLKHRLTVLTNNLRLLSDAILEKVIFKKKIKYVFFLVENWNLNNFNFLGFLIDQSMMRYKQTGGLN